MKNRTPSFSEMIEGKEQVQRVLQWWYSLVVPSFQVYRDDSFYKREHVRTARLLSVVLGSFLAVALFFLPACLFIPNHWIFWIDVGCLCTAVITIFILRAGNAPLAGIFLIVAYELAYAAMIFTTIPVDISTVQYYDIPIIGLLLCVVFLPSLTVFLVLGVNIILILVSLLWLPHDAYLTRELPTQFLPILFRPVGLQSVVATVSYFFVDRLQQANFRAGRAEAIARMEHEVAEQQQERAKQREKSEKEKEDIETAIRYLVMAYAAMMNGDIKVQPIPYPESSSSKILWPLIGMFNVLWPRLQSTQQAEHELHRIQDAINQYVSLIEKAPPGELPQSKTDTSLDLLIIALSHFLRVGPSDSSGGKATPPALTKETGRSV